MTPHPSSFLSQPSKKILKAISLELRHLLEGYYDSDGKWQPGDLEQRLAAIGVRRDRAPVPVDELAHLSDDDKHARTVVDAYLQLRDEADVSRKEAVAEFVRETAYTWANRLFCLRCMEARELIDEVILQKEAYGGRSLEHHRLAQREPEVCSGEDDGLFAVLEKVFTDQTEHLPLLFEPQSPGVALKPSPAVLKRCLALLSGIEAVRSLDPATGEVFQAPDALGWAYQYWNTEEKDRVFEMVRTKKGAKIAGADIIPATQLYTEPYMVKFLVQNSLGATWMGMHPDSKLYEKWEYYVRDADRAPAEKKPMAEIRFLDPACGSGHFLIEAFDLYYDMYEEEGELTEAEDICGSILEKNLFGIDIDARAVQIAEAALWMKAAERAFDFQGAATNLVAAVASHLKGDLWEEFLAGFEREPSVARVLRKFGQAMEHIDELGSLARPEEELQTIIQEEHATWERQVRERVEANYLFPEMAEDAVSGNLPFHEISDEEFGDRLFFRVRAAIDGFTVRSREEGVFQDQFLGRETIAGFRLLSLLVQHFDVIAANPPYMSDVGMGKTLRQYLGRAFPTTRSDLFAAFVARATELGTQGSHVAMVVQRVIMYNADYEALRAALSSQGFPSCVAVLGPGGFSEISGEMVDSILFILCQASRPVTSADKSIFIDLTSEKDKDTALLESLRVGETDARVFLTRPGRFSVIPGSPWAFELSDRTLELFESWPGLTAVSKCRAGISTGSDPRFTRCRWEIQHSAKRWYPVVDGGEHERWWRSPVYWIDAEDNFARPRNNLNESGRTRSAIRNTTYQGRAGITYLKNAGRRFAGRFIEEGTYFLDTGRCIFPPTDNRPLLLGVLNSRCASRLLCVIGGGGSFVNADIERLPLKLDKFEHTDLSEHVEKAVAAARGMEAYNVVHTPASSKRRSTLVSTIQATRNEMATLLNDVYLAENRIEEIVGEAYRVPVGKEEPFPVTDTRSDEDYAAFFAESTLLQLLSHRWPKQIEAGDRVPDWADPDGIIPLTEGTDESTLLERIRDRVTTEFEGGDVASVEREFAEIMGKPLETWLSMDFFKHHTRQFKKRPIAWQIQSGTFTARKKPAFACLVYYHKLDGDLLPKIRNQYVGPLRSRLETELRSIESVSSDARSDRQEGRRSELEDQIDELRDFDATLQKVINEGFSSKELTKIVKDEPLDKWCSLDGTRPEPESQEALLQQESRYFPDINDGVRVNIAPLQKAGLLAADVLAKKDLDKAIADRAQWRADERRWCREQKLPQPGWWPEQEG